MEEQLVSTQSVVGSSPTTGTVKKRFLIDIIEIFDIVELNVKGI